ncbi:MAG: pantothenate kinase [Chroococcidiopsidaceae cyanobacterium CP_BM_ER_R8_30]|nr:pantothenate kinase [Chroococcidiopsidaceae cyanobacterium CP_BM_ER_R8_30]
MNCQSASDTKDTQRSWLGLMIGNSRLHWAWFIEETLCCAWDTAHLPDSAVRQLAQCQVANFPPNLFHNQDSLLPLYLASVVPRQTRLWQAYPDVRVITLEQLPLRGTYPTLGIDRALGLWGAGETGGWPVLTIDAGTALTFTGADANRCLVGGAILPGLGLQFQSLAQSTAQSPLVDAQKTELPPRWALGTPDAIRSGIIYTLLAGIQDYVQTWWQEFPNSQIMLTGGDSALLLTHLQSRFPNLATKLIYDPHLIFWGIKFCRSASG